MNKYLSCLLLTCRVVVASDQMNVDLTTATTINQQTVQENKMSVEQLNGTDPQESVTKKRKREDNADITEELSASKRAKTLEDFASKIQQKDAKAIIEIFESLKKECPKGLEFYLIESKKKEHLIQLIEHYDKDLFEEIGIPYLNDLSQFSQWKDSNIFHLALEFNEIQILRDFGDRYAELAHKVTNYTRWIITRAATQGKTQFVKELAVLFPELVKQVATDGQTIFHMAAKGGHTQFVKELAPIFPEFVLRTTDEGETILHSAARNGHTQFVREISELFPGLILQTNNKGETIFHSAAIGERTEFVRDLGKEYPDLIRRVTNDGNTIFHVAANEHGDTYFALDFAKEYPDLISQLNNEGETIFHTLTMSYDVESIVELGKLFPELIAEGDSEGYTILHNLASNGEYGFVETLAKEFAGLITQAADYGWTIFHEAAAMGRTEFVLALADTYPDLIKQTTTDGRTIFHSAAFHGQIEFLRELSQKYPGLVTQSTNYEKTIFHAAAFGAQTDVMLYTATWFPELIARNFDNHTGLKILLKELKANSVENEVILSENLRKLFVQCCQFIDYQELLDFTQNKENFAEIHKFIERLECIRQFLPGTNLAYDQPVAVSSISEVDPRLLVEVLDQMNLDKNHVTKVINGAQVAKKTLMDESDASYITYLLEFYDIADNNKVLSIEEFRDTHYQESFDRIDQFIDIWKRYSIPSLKTLVFQSWVKGFGNFNLYTGENLDPTANNMFTDKQTYFDAMQQIESNDGLIFKDIPISASAKNHALSAKHFFTRIMNTLKR